MASVSDGTSDTTRRTGPASGTGAPRSSNSGGRVIVDHVACVGRSPDLSPRDGTVLARSS